MADGGFSLMYSASCRPADAWQGRSQRIVWHKAADLGDQHGARSRGNMRNVIALGKRLLRIERITLVDRPLSWWKEEVTPKQETVQCDGSCRGPPQNWRGRAYVIVARPLSTRNRSFPACATAANFPKHWRKMTPCRLWPFACCGSATRRVNCRSWPAASPIFTEPSCSGCWIVWLALPARLLLLPSASWSAA